MKTTLLPALVLFASASFAFAQFGDPPLPIDRPGLVPGPFEKFGRLPDLIITEVKVLDGMGRPHGTQAKVYVKNIGNGPAKNCLLAVKVLDAKGAVKGLHFAPVPALGAGASIGVLIDTGPHAHPRILRFTVDSAAAVLESNEKNNVRVHLVP